MAEGCGRDDATWPRAMGLAGACEAIGGHDMSTRTGSTGESREPRYDTTVAAVADDSGGKSSTSPQLRAR